MTRHRIAIVGSLLLTAALAWAQNKTEEASEAVAPPPLLLTALVSQVAEQFPQIDGDVVEVRGKNITVSVGRRQGVRAGLTFTVYREGREIRHPKTRELLGRTEEAVGRATVSQVFDTLSIAAFDGGEVRTNDRVRVGIGKTRVTLLAFRGGIRDNLFEAVTHELYEGLVGSGRFEVVLGDQISVWLTQQGITPEAFVQGKRVAEAAAQFKADNILAVTFKTVERKPFMELRLFTQPRPEPALSTAFFVPP